MVFMDMIIISSVDNYSPYELKILVESLNNVGYNGTKIMITHDVYDITTEYLNENGWVTINISLDMLQHIQRYKNASDILKDYPNDYVLFIDCRDVYFNLNPEEWNLDSDLYVGVDGFMKTKSHSWGKENMMKSFHDFYPTIENETHLNCGVVYGKGSLMVNFLNDVYETSLKSNQRQNLDPHDFTPDDQMALNVMVYTKYKDQIRIQDVNDRFFINMAQTKWDGKMDYYLYHQYDRVESFQYLF